MSRETLLAELLRIPVAERYALLLAMFEHRKANETDALDDAIYAEVKRRCRLIEAGQIDFPPWKPVDARVPASTE